MHNHRPLLGSLADLVNRHTRACVMYRDSFLGMTNLGTRHELSQDGALREMHCCLTDNDCSSPIRFLQKRKGVAQSESFPTRTLLLSVLKSTSWAFILLLARSSSQHATCHMPTNTCSELSRVSRCAIDEPGKVKCHAR